MIRTVLITFLFVCISSAVDLNLVWDSSDTPGVSYVLYATTNTMTSENLHTSNVSVDTGTNQQTILKDIAPGKWSFAVTAYMIQTNVISQPLSVPAIISTNKIESAPSNFLFIEVPTAPVILRVIVVEANATLVGTNWLDIGFFKIKVLP